MTWSDSYVSIDTETTGFGPDARILEVAVVTFEKGEVVREWSQLLWPEGVDWSDVKVKEALAINHIDVETLKGKPAFAQVVPDLFMELSQEVWVAHNADFDVRMLNQELMRLKRPMLAVPSIVACTWNLAMYISKTKYGNKLAEVAARFNVPVEDAHRAAGDARTCGRIFEGMRRAGHLPADAMDMVGLCKRADAERRGRRTS